MDKLTFYIGGEWVRPYGKDTFEVKNPATEEVIGKIAMGNEDDVDAAVTRARGAFFEFSLSSREERISLLRRILEIYKARKDDIAQAITMEMGAPITFSREQQVITGPANISSTLDALSNYPFEERMGSTLLVRDAIGVTGLITPWNWPINQIMAKVAPALAAGCSMVLKPSEYAPLSANILAEILDEAGVPPGVFNLIHGDGETVGNAMSGHQDIDLISFTGSTRAGIKVATQAAGTLKRVTQELGGKSGYIIIPDANLQNAVTDCARRCFMNSGQNCNAPTRLLVPQYKQEEASDIAKSFVESLCIGDTMDEGTTLGPVVNERQFNRIQHFIESGEQEGAKLVTGGKGRPKNIKSGWYVRPTIFTEVEPGMTIAREEIFGPVLSILTYSDLEDAIRIANSTTYGLAGYVYSSDLETACNVARQLRAGSITINAVATDWNAPFGGYRKSGNGRERGRFGMDEYIELKALQGYQ